MLNTDVSNCTEHETKCLLEAADILKKIPIGLYNYMRHWKKTPQFVSIIVKCFRYSGLTLNDFARRLGIETQSLYYFNDGMDHNGIQWPDLIRCLNKIPPSVKVRAETVNVNRLEQQRRIRQEHNSQVKAESGILKTKLGSFLTRGRDVEKSIPSYGETRYEKQVLNNGKRLVIPPPPYSVKSPEQPIKKTIESVTNEFRPFIRPKNGETQYFVNETNLPMTIIPLANNNIVSNSFTPIHEFTIDNVNNCQSDNSQNDIVSSSSNNFKVESKVESKIESQLPALDSISESEKELLDKLAASYNLPYNLEPYIKTKLKEIKGTHVRMPWKSHPDIVAVICKDFLKHDGSLNSFCKKYLISDATFNFYFRGLKPTSNNGKKAQEWKELIVELSKLNISLDDLKNRLDVIYENRINNKYVESENQFEKIELVNFQKPEMKQEYIFEQSCEQSQQPIKIQQPIVPFKPVKIVPNNPIAYESCESTKISISEKIIVQYYPNNNLKNNRSENQVQVLTFDSLENIDKLKINSNKFELLDYCFDSKGNIIAKLKLN